MMYDADFLFLALIILINTLIQLQTEIEIICDYLSYRKFILLFLYSVY